MPQRPSGRLTQRILLGASTLALVATVAQAAPTSSDATEAFGIRGPAMAKAVKPARQAPSQRLGVELARVPLVALSSVDNEELLREDQLLATLPGMRTKVLRFGVGRDVAVSALDGSWTNMPDGSRFWVAEVASPNALALRLHVTDARLPAGAELAIYGLEDRAAPEFHFGSPAAKSAFWTGTVVGERARIEYLAPAGSPDELPFRLDRLQHVYLDPVREVSLAKTAGPCHNDVACFPEWVGLSRAVAGIGFIGANSLYCTGQLLNVSGPADFTPYFLTANHCMDTQFDAESSEFFWNWQREACGGSAPSITSVQRSQGASLISTNSLSDYTLLIVEGAIPAGELVWAGWTSKEPSNGTDAIAIHHPANDLKKVSPGVKEIVNECFNFPGFAGRKLVRTSWTTNAVTEGGSSGSGIFRADTGQLYGQLLGGPSFCGIQPEGLFDCYGSFATTFTRIKNQLKAGPDDKSEQNDSCAKARLIKGGTTGGRVVKLFDQDWYKISVPKGKSVTVDVSFSNASGDVDIQAFGACNTGDPLASSDSTTDIETFAVQNVGNKPALLYFRVFLADDTRNTYDINVSFQ